jgi:hypothetical protein
MVSTILEPTMGKRSGEKRSYKTVKLLEHLVVKAAIITQVSDETAADYLSRLLEQSTIEKDYAEALGRLQSLKVRKGKTSEGVE